jgi:hypothetical protein
VWSFEKNAALRHKCRNATDDTWEWGTRRKKAYARIDHLILTQGLFSNRLRVLGRPNQIGVARRHRRLERVARQGAVAKSRCCALPCECTRRGEGFRAASIVAQVVITVVTVVVIVIVVGIVVVVTRITCSC